jgi:tRNA A37 threonylcarbamoyladenosine dehydratase
MDEKELYKRQTELDLAIPKNVLVLGAGGIGSWAALGFALSGVKDVTIVDPDILEIHNLNRTPYKLNQEGMHKVIAMADLISERRINCNVLPIAATLESALLPLEPYDVIIDCTDTLFCKQHLKDRKYKGTYVKLGYDGTSVTIDPNLYSEIWELEGEGYTIVPSYLVPPALVAFRVIDTILRRRTLKEITADIEKV